MSTQATNIPDVDINDQGSIVGFTPRTEAARTWFDENVESEPWQWMGPSLYVDHRPAQGLLEGIQEAGLTIG